MHPRIIIADDHPVVLHGIRIVLSRETSWAGVRDKLMTGELDAAHACEEGVTVRPLWVSAVLHDLYVAPGGGELQPRPEDDAFWREKA